MKKLRIVFLLFMLFGLTFLFSCSHEHSYSKWEITKEPTCIEEGTKVRTCKCGKSETVPIEALGHKEKVVKGKEATCTEPGLTEGKKCSVCGETTVAQEIVGVLNHAYGTEYFYDEINHWYECTCGKKTGKENHLFSGWIITKEPKITEPGSKYRECTKCYYKNEVEIDKITEVFEFKEEEVTIVVGSQNRLEYSYDGNADVIFTSSNDNVVVIVDDMIIGGAEGTAVITASTSTGIKEILTVNVIVPIERIYSYTTSGQVIVGVPKKINTSWIYYSPSNATTSAYKKYFFSSNPDVLSIDEETGEYECLSKGVTTITVRIVSAVNSLEISLEVYAVEPIEPESVTLKYSERTLEEGDSFYISSTISPSSANFKNNITFSSSDESVATINSSGKITAISAGTCVITATTENGLTATCIINVTFNIYSSNGENLTNAYKYALCGDVENIDAPNGTILTSSDESILTISNNETLNFIGSGEVILIATKDGVSVKVYYTVYKFTYIKTQTITNNADIGGFTGSAYAYCTVTITEFYFSEGYLHLTMDVTKDSGLSGPHKINVLIYQEGGTSILYKTTVTTDYLGVGASTNVTTKINMSSVALINGVYEYYLELYRVAW